MKRIAFDIGEHSSRLQIQKEGEAYLRRNVIWPLKLMIDTDDRPSPTSPTILRPSCDLKLLFQKSFNAMRRAGDAASKRNAESPGMRIVMSPLFDLNS